VSDGRSDFAHLLDATTVLRTVEGHKAPIRHLAGRRATSATAGGHSDQFAARHPSPRTVSSPLIGLANERLVRAQMAIVVACPPSVTRPDPVCASTDPTSLRRCVNATSSSRQVYHEGVVIR
jgi:hypothetical protein